MSAPTIPREEFHRRAKAIIRKIDALFVDCARWNRLHPNEESIEADPDGTMVRMRASLADFLHREGEWSEP